MFDETLRLTDEQSTTDALLDAMHMQQAGHVIGIEIVPAGRVGGLDHGGAWVDVVVLDGDVIAYRYSDDSVDTPWQLGEAADAVEMALAHKQTHDERSRIGQRARNELNAGAYA